MGAHLAVANNRLQQLDDSVAIVAFQFAPIFKLSGTQADVRIAFAIGQQFSILIDYGYLPGFQMGNAR